MGSRPVSNPAPRVDLLTFELGGQRCALLAPDVVEVQRAVSIARLPRGPEIVEGVIDRRGQVVPVLGIRSRFALPPSPLAPSDWLIFVRVPHPSGATRVAAIRVDRALDLVPVETGRIEDARSLLAGVEHVAGVAKLDDGTVVIHDLRRFLSLEEHGALDRALPGEGGEP